MTDFILAPMIAFFIYLLVVSIVSRLGRLFAAYGPETEFKSATYASGEANDSIPAAHSYSKYFVVALFFAVLHLGILMVGSSGLSLAAVPYLLGLILILVALILG
jgi:NADH:ubiquinone oxidoreductase subunit 3 (subunit A)